MENSNTVNVGNDVGIEYIRTKALHVILSKVYYSSIHENTTSQYKF